MNELVFVAMLLGNMTVTSYRSVEKQTDTTPFITSTGGHVHRDGVALSRDLLSRWGGPVNYGDIVYVEDYGFKVVNDCMNRRHKNRVDMWVKTYEEEKAVGVRRRHVWLIKTKLQRK